MRKSIIAFGLVGAVLGMASLAAEAAPRGPVRFYDQNGNDRGYLWCLYDTSISDCSYFNHAQCASSASGRCASCVLNPFAIAQGYTSSAVEPAKPRQRLSY